MAKLTTLEGDFDFYGEVSKADPFFSHSLLGADEVMVGGFSIGKTLRVTGRVAGNTVKTVAAAPLQVTKAIVSAPLTLAKLADAPKAVVKVAQAVTYAPRKLIDGMQTVQSAILNPTTKIFSVPEVAYNKVVSPLANIAMRNPVTTAVVTGGASLIAQSLTQKGRSLAFGKKSVIQKAGGVALRNPLLTAAVTGGASLLPTVMTATGRKNLFGRASTVQQTANFIQRNPYLTAIPTGGASLIAGLATKRGRQALAGRKPGVRNAPGLTGADADEFLTLRNKSNPSLADKMRIAFLDAKGKAQLTKDKLDADKKAAESAQAANATSPSGQSVSSGGGGGGGNESGSSPETEPEKASPVGGILLAAGLGALMLL